MRYLLAGLLLLAVVTGCNSGEPAAASTTTAGASPDGAGKDGAAKGMSIDSVQVTSAGANADKMTGSKSGGN